MDVVKRFYKLCMNHTSAVSWMCEVSHDLNSSALELKVDSNALVSVVVCSSSVAGSVAGIFEPLVLIPFLTYDLLKPSDWPHLYQHF